MQFLVESATMALVGGAFGVVGGIMVAQIVTVGGGVSVDGGVVGACCWGW